MLELINTGMLQPEHATLKGFENLDLSDLTLGVDWDFALVITANNQVLPVLDLIKLTVFDYVTYILEDFIQDILH